MNNIVGYFLFFLVFIGGIIKLLIFFLFFVINVNFLGNEILWVFKYGLEKVVIFFIVFVVILMLYIFVNL